MTKNWSDNEWSLKTPEKTAVYNVDSLARGNNKI